MQLIFGLHNNMQYQTKIYKAFWDIHGKSTYMALGKITFVMGQQGQKSKRPHDTVPISLTANFVKIRSMVYDTDLTLKTTAM